MKTPLLAIGLSLAAIVIPARAGMRELFLQQLTDVEKKMNGLAQAVPAEKYSWRPAEGIRSISEVFMHVAGANYMFPSMAGFKPPQAIDRNHDKTPPHT